MRLLILLLSFVGVAVPVKRNYNNEIAHWNKVRRHFAKTNAIPNMWKLIEDETLAEVVPWLPQNCSDLRPKPGFRFYFSHGGIPELHFSDNLLIWFDKTEKTDPAAVIAKQNEMEKTGGFFIEIINPNQNRIGCAPYECHITVDGIELEYGTLCLLGPNEKYGIHFPVDPKSGRRPGSDCGTGWNDDGLCTDK